nr:MFS transporter [Propionibacterium freudenreichii]
MDRDRILARLRQPPAPVRPDLRHHRPAHHAPTRPGRLRRRLRPRRAAPTFGILIAARALQGAAGAAIAPAALSLLSTTFTDAKDRAKAFAIFGGISGSGAAVGMILGGVLTQFLNWRFTLFVNVVIALVAIIGAIVLIPRHAPATTKPRLDALGTVLACAGLFSIVFGFANVEAQSWSGSGTWAFLAAGVLLLAAFVWWQTRTTHPLLPLRIILNRTRGGANLAIFIAGIGLFAAFLFLSYFMQQTLAFTPLATGLAFLPMVVGIVIAGGIATTQLAPRFGPRAPISLGLLAAAAALVWLTGISTHSSYAGSVLGPLVLFGLGVGATIAPAMNAGTANVRPEDAGIASATVNIAQQIGGSIGTALLNSIAAATLAAYLIGTNDHSPAGQAAATIHSYTTTFWVAAAVFTAGAAACALILQQHRNETSTPTSTFSDPGQGPK